MIANAVTFSLFDYVVFSLMLFLTALIGFYYAWKERHKKNVDQVLLGGRKLQNFPVAMSILASFTSAISILGFSQEMYLYGSMYWLIGLSYFITQPFAALIYVPFFHNLKLTSAYEYLEKRFNYCVRVTASMIFCIEMFLYMAVVLYTPSIAIQAVTGISLWVSIFITGAICTVYTSLGGMKAVVFTDTFQVFVMFSGLIAIIVEGAIRVGGFGVIYQRAKEGDRLELFDFDPSPVKRHTFWSIMVGGFFTSLTVYGSNQATIQRYFSVPSVRDAQIAMYINLIGTFAILSVCCVCGFVAFAFFFGCDPKLDGKITNYNQILPYLVMELLKDYYGLPGLFIACIYSAALSSVSSGLNSLTAVVLHDFIYPLNGYLKKSEFNQKRSMMLSRILSAIFGMITVGLAFLCKYAGTTVLQISLSIFGLLGGPLLGVFSLGMFVPFANSYGAMTGLVASIIVNFWLGIGAIKYGDRPKMKPFPQDSCLASNNTHIHFYNTTLSSIIDSKNTGFSQIYNLSYYWYSLIAVSVVFFFGITISLLTKRNKGRSFDPNLFFQFKLLKEPNFRYEDEKQANIQLIEKIPIDKSYELENPS